MGEINQGTTVCSNWDYLDVGDLAATSVTPLIARVDSADLAG